MSEAHAFAVAAVAALAVLTYARVRRPNTRDKSPRLSFIGVGRERSVSEWQEEKREARRMENEQIAAQFATKDRAHSMVGGDATEGSNSTGSLEETPATPVSPRADSKDDSQPKPETRPRRISEMYGPVTIG